MTETDKRFHVALFNDNTVRFSDYKEGNDLISISFKEYKDAVDCRDALMYHCNLMNELVEENKQYQQWLDALREELSLADRDNTALEKENKELKAFIKSLCDKNNEIWLDDGSIYRLRKIFKGEWVK